MMDITTLTQVRTQLARLQQVGIVPFTEEIRAAQAVVARSVAETGRIIRDLDGIIDLLHTERARGARELLTQARAIRAVALDHMRQLSPEQAWFWTEAWQGVAPGPDASPDRPTASRRAPS